MAKYRKTYRRRNRGRGRTQRRRRTQRGGQRDEFFEPLDEQRVMK